MRTNPYDQALTIDEWREAQATTSRPLTWPWSRSPRITRDRALSRLVQPRPRNRPEEPAA